VVANGSSKHQDSDVRKRIKESKSEDTNKTKECSHDEHDATPKVKEIKVLDLYQ
jgi:hypothetical protein